MFKVLGVLVALYVAQAISSGRVYVRSGPWGRTVLRDESPHRFWIAIVIYAGLSVALLTVF